MSVEPTKLQSIHDAIEYLHPIEVEFYHLSAHVDESKTVRSHHEDASTDGESAREESAEIEIRTATRMAEFGVDYRCHIKVHLPDAELVVDGAILYQADAQIEMSETVCKEFGDEVAIMSLFPYLRQAVGDLALRIGRTVTLPLLERGQITFSID